MITPGRIPLTEAESEAIDSLLAQHQGLSTLTRRDPGETGPVLVHFGDETWEIDDAGVSTKRATMDGVADDPG